jgi:hypothetical protein
VTFFLLVFFIAIHLFLLIKIGPDYTQRVELTKRLIAHCQTLEGQKFVLNGENASLHKSYVLWVNYPNETMMLSALQKDSKVITIVNNDPLKKWKLRTLGSNRVIINSYDYPSVYLSYFNSNYFKIAAGDYSYLSLDSSNVREEITGKISLLPNRSVNKISDNMTWEQSKTLRLPVKIENTSSQPIYSSRSNGLYLSYYWKMADKVNSVKGFMTPIEVDVISDYSQYMEIQTPDVPSNYLLTIDLFQRSDNLDMSPEAQMSRRAHLKTLKENGLSPSLTYKSFDKKNWIGVGSTLPVTITD